MSEPSLLSILGYVDRPVQMRVWECPALNCRWSYSYAIEATQQPDIADVIEQKIAQHVSTHVIRDWLLTIADLRTALAAAHKVNIR